MLLAIRRHAQPRLVLVGVAADPDQPADVRQPARASGRQFDGARSDEQQLGASMVENTGDLFPGEPEVDHGP
jgi:hypothetical protein